MRPGIATRRAAPAAPLVAVCLAVCLAVSLAVSLAAGCSLLGSDDGPPEQPDPGTQACAEVRAALDAFDAGDFEEAVERFEAAVPLAEDRAERTPSERADLLLEAVRWYAALAPEDYPEARDSDRFARYQAITVAQCVVGEPGDDVSSGGVTV